MNDLYELYSQKLKSDFEKIKRLLTETEGTSVHTFILRILEWRKTKPQLLWEFLHRVADYQSLTFMGDFGSFVGNCLLDDSSYKIEWVKPLYEKHDLVWLPNGEYKKICTHKEDKEARPEVVWCYDDYGLTSAEPLLEAMDILDERDTERRLRIEETQSLIEEFYSRIGEK